MGDKAFDLLAGGFAEGLGTAEIDGVRLSDKDLFSYNLWIMKKNAPLAFRVSSELKKGL